MNLLLLLFQCLIPLSQPFLTQNEWIMPFGHSETGITQVPPNGAYFDFPSFDSGNTANYFLHSQHGPISGTLSISVAVATTGTPVFHKDSDPSNNCVTVPGAHLFFSAAPYAVDSTDFHRWWATPASGSYTLSAGTATLSVALVPGNWTSVSGVPGNFDGTAAAGFNNALATATYVGVTFGGGCFYGHGVSVSTGTARFTVSDFSVQ